MKSMEKDNERDWEGISELAIDYAKKIKQIREIMGKEDDSITKELVNVVFLEFKLIMRGRNL